VERGNLFSKFGLPPFLGGGSRLRRADSGTSCVDLGLRSLYRFARRLGAQGVSFRLRTLQRDTSAFDTRLSSSNLLLVWA
jgi:hypothetical protein